MIEVKSYEQTTFETCLPACLLLLANRKASQNAELKFLNHALKFSKRDYTIGNLDYFAKRFNAKLAYFIEDKKRFNLLKKMRFHKNIKLINRKIDQKLISGLIEKSPIIVYLDNYILTKAAHYPHFILAAEKNGNNFTISDPWDGKIKTISSNLLYHGISSLRNKIRISPRAIQIV